MMPSWPEWHRTCLNRKVSLTLDYLLDFRRFDYALRLRVCLFFSALIRVCIDTSRSCKIDSTAMNECLTVAGIGARSAGWFVGSQ